MDACLSRRAGCTKRKIRGYDSWKHENAIVHCTIQILFHSRLTASGGNVLIGLPAACGEFRKAD
jgi:hypothetical protein